MIILASFYDLLDHFIDSVFRTLLMISKTNSTNEHHNLATFKAIIQVQIQARFSKGILCSKSMFLLLQGLRQKRFDLSHAIHKHKLLAPCSMSLPRALSFTDLLWLGTNFILPIFFHKIIAWKFLYNFALMIKKIIFPISPFQALYGNTSMQRNIICCMFVLYRSRLGSPILSKSPHIDVFLELHIYIQEGVHGLSYW